LVDRPPAGTGWLHEVKHDGFRILALKQGDRAQVWSRRGANFTYRFPAIAEAVRSLSADQALIDGEAVVLRIDGRSDFAALMTKRGGAEATLVAFDLLRLNGDDLRLRPLETRREALQRLVDGANGILFSEAIAAEGAVVFAKACELGLEGVVSKRAGSFYRCGRSRNWLKTINPDFVRT
jgi:bifunctional non-homologous end joining protein LigD